ncbi:MAG: TIGR00299 family protein [Acidobacteria bacterium 13_1_20CM_2_55_15]|nr:MAG: TIGR00299 family protein [Acidobacteria bacterium 13_1_20CM_2_55_15]
MKTLYFDCFSGISGDMTIGALLDLGLDFDYLKTELKKLPVEGYELRASRVMRSNLSAMKFDVLMEGAGENHRHEHHHGGHSHFHRKAAEILSMIRDSNLTAGAKRFAVDIFTKLAISEGKVHNVPPDDVEFHEVGAVDSIVDTVGTAIGFDALAAGNFLCSPINIGSGFIHCQHGIMPVPVPATADLLRHAPIYQKHAQTELVTPTGAAILAAVVNRFGPMPAFSSDRIGYGAGTKQFPDFPNCLRLMIGEETAVPPDRSSRSVVVLEANIDDMTPQNFGYVTEKLFAAGALDVLTIPVQMKKGRPGHLLQVLAERATSDALSKIIFHETTTIGIRRHAVDRTTLERQFIEVETKYGKVKIKVSKLDGEVVNAAPEYEDCARIAREADVPLKQVQAAAMKSYLNRENAG